MQTYPPPEPEPLPARMTWEIAERTPVDDLPPRFRVDGWVPERQAAFLEALSEGETVERACRRAGMSVASAYAFRRRAAGHAFAVGWRAAALHAREAVEARLMERALEGELETVTRPDGTTITRHRYNFRLAIAMLTRLDKLADQTGGNNPFEHAARAAHAGFEEYVDCIRRGEAGDATAFLISRAISETAEAEASPLVRAAAAMREADRFLGGDDAYPHDEDFDNEEIDEDEDDEADDDATGALAPVDIADLVHAERQGWTNEQWERAEAAGLVTIDAPPLEWRHNPQLPKVVQVQPEYQGHGKARRVRYGDGPWHPASQDPGPPDLSGLYVGVWTMPGDPDILCTAIAPPKGFDGLERGTWGVDEDYWRAMTVREAKAAHAAHARDLRERRAHEKEEMDEWLKPKAA